MNGGVLNLRSITSTQIALPGGRLFTLKNICVRSNTQIILQVHDGEENTSVKTIIIIVIIIIITFILTVLQIQQFLM